MQTAQFWPIRTGTQARGDENKSAKYGLTAFKDQITLHLRLCSWNRVAQNAQGVVKGVINGVTRASFGRRAPLTPQFKRASARRGEEKDFRGAYKIQQVAAVHLGWGQAPSLETENGTRVHSMGAT